MSQTEVSACNVGDLGSMPGLGRSPGEGNGNPLQNSCLENFHGLRSLVGYRPWGHKESDTSEWLPFLSFLSFFLKSCFTFQEMFSFSLCSMGTWKQGIFCHCWVWCYIYVSSVRCVNHVAQTIYFYLSLLVISVTERARLNVSHIDYVHAVLHCFMSSSLSPWGFQPPRLLCPWDSPGNNTGVGCHSLLQGIFPTQGLGLLHSRQILYHLSH